MNRRDFLFFRTTSTVRTLELSCRSLYMRHLDSELLTRAERHPSELGYEPWMGEPPTVFARGTGASLLRQVEDDLKNVDVLRVLEPEWLRLSGLGEQIEPLLAGFRARGGRVEFTREHGQVP
jgi:hypothetical protein